MSNKFTPNEGRLFLFPNKEQKSGKSPQITGKAMIGGTLKQISLWKTDKGNGVYYSGVITDFVEHKGKIKDDSPDDLF